jgi:FKBP-type peptidyl-prolyl cis-trans isomerase FklB
MQKYFVAAVLSAVLATPAMAQDLESEPGELGYAVGYEFGTQLNSYDMEMDLEAVFQAIRDAYAERDPAIDVQIMRERLMALQEKVRQERMEAFEALAEDNKVKAEEFLAENADKTGIETLPSGVQYRVIEQGSGERPSLEDTVTFHYRVSKISGREVDSSYRTGVPAVAPVNGLIEGWQEVLPLMREGAVWQVFLPPELAFGMRGDPPAIGPNEALKFDLELVQIGVPEDYEGQQRGQVPGTDQ